MLKNIIAEKTNEPFNVDIEMLHEALLEMPAAAYFELYGIMKREIEGKTNDKR